MYANQKNGSESPGLTQFLMDVENAALYLGIKPSYLRHLRMKKCGPVPFQPSGKSGKLFFTCEALDTWIKNKEQ